MRTDDGTSGSANEYSSRRMTRRTALKVGGTLAAAFAAAPPLVARGAQEAATPVAGINATAAWEQYKSKGIQLDFLSEDTPPTAAIIGHISEFEELTGIKVNITQTNLADVVTKVLLDFTSQAGEIDVIYADPQQIMAPLYGNFTDLRQFIDDSSLPPLPLGLEDFDEMNLIGSGYMIDREKLLAIPYDAPTMLLVYRADIFENPTYRDQYQAEKGYDWTPGPNITWEQYRDIAEWINTKVADGTIAEQVAGTGHQAKQYDSLMCDFSNVLLASGGGYFENPDYATWGTATPGGSTLDSPEALKAASLYKSILDQAAPGSLSWDWNGLAEAFSAGSIAMAPEWHEYASVFEDETLSTVAGKVKWALLPKGPAGTKNLWGGTGLAVNSYAGPDQQRAAWMFITWATSPEVQKRLLSEGSTPTRTSVFEDPEVQQLIKAGTNALVNMLPLVLEAWKHGSKKTSGLRKAKSPPGSR